MWVAGLFFVLRVLFLVGLVLVVWRVLSARLLWVEAFTLACVGGLIGIVAGLATAQGTSLLGHWPVLVSPFSIVLGFVSAAAVGIVFGFYPAQRAAALDPIVALRYE